LLDPQFVGFYMVSIECFECRMVASLDRKRLGQAALWKARNTSEAFSIRRLGGSRWRLRADALSYGI
jgi:hypothetical protein